MLFYVVLRHVTLGCYITLRYVVLCCVVLCYVTLRCVMLCYNMLCYVTVRYVVSDIIVDSKCASCLTVTNLVSLLNCLNPIY
jgi:hypothetical protein